MAAQAASQDSLAVLAAVRLHGGDRHRRMGLPARVPSFAKGALIQPIWWWRSRARRPDGGGGLLSAQFITMTRLNACRRGRESAARVT